MVATSKEPLFCRACGKPLKKWTKTVYVREKPGKHDHSVTYARYAYVGDRPPLTKADATRLSNLAIVSVAYGTFSGEGEEIAEKLNGPNGEKTTVRLSKIIAERAITSFQEWDGESYADDLFCTNTCAIAFGRGAAKRGGENWGTAAWHKAVARARESKQKEGTR